MLAAWRRLEANLALAALDGSTKGNVLLAVKQEVIINRIAVNSSGIVGTKLESRTGLGNSLDINTLRRTTYNTRNNTSHSGISFFYLVSGLLLSSLFSNDECILTSSHSNVNNYLLSHAAALSGLLVLPVNTTLPLQRLQ
jgi:hypothetical protein